MQPEKTTENLPATRISVQPEDDWCLWVVRGKLPDGFEFSLPIKARPHRNGVTRYFQVPGSGNYTNQQWMELTAIFDAHDSCPQQKDYWFCESNFLKFASAVRGLNPEFYTKWPGFVARSNPEDDSPETIDLEAEPGFSAGELKFLKRVHYLLDSGLSWEALKILWLAVRKEAIRQLSIDLKTLDLGFVRIAAMPYRQNWKEALCVRFQPQRAALSLLAALHRPRDQWHEHFHAMGLFNALASAKLLALNCRNWSKPSARWSLEILPSPDLQRAMEEQEVHREDHLGPARYAAWLLKQMAKRLNLALEILKHYTENVRLPPGKVKEGNQFGTQVLTPMRETGQIRPGTGLCESLQLCPEEAFQKFSDEPAGEENDTAWKMRNFAGTRLLKDVPEESQLTPKDSP